MKKHNSEIRNFFQIRKRSYKTSNAKSNDSIDTYIPENLNTRRSKRGSGKKFKEDKKEYFYQSDLKKSSQPMTKEKIKNHYSQRKVNLKLF
jgi:hypothetical protein